MGLHPSGFMWGSRCGASFPQIGEKNIQKAKSLLEMVIFVLGFN